MSKRPKFRNGDEEIEALIRENTQKLNYWLDIYNDYMVLYKIFHDDEFLKKST